MHRVIDPKILYCGTPVVLITTRNEDGSANIAPMSATEYGSALGSRAACHRLNLMTMSSQ